MALGVQLGAIVAAVLLTGGLLVFDNQPTPRAPIVLSNISWSERWDSNQSGFGFQLPSLLGDCSNTALINTSGSNFTCVFVIQLVDEKSNTTNGTSGQVQISSISVAAPFSLVGT